MGEEGGAKTPPEHGPGERHSPGMILSKEMIRCIEELARELARTPVVGALRAAREDAGRREATRIMWRDLRQRERKLAEKEAAGQSPTPEELEEFRRVAQVVGLNPYIRALMDAEMGFAMLMAAIQRVLVERLELPAMPEDEGEEKGVGSDRDPGPVATGPERPASPDPGKPARSRLWVPGQP